MIVFYWGDIAGFLEEEADRIKDALEEAGIQYSRFEIKEQPQCLGERFDVLFFDWGGMSVGNNMLDHYCRRILQHAKDHPGRVYVMVSAMTSYAMRDALETFGSDRPANLFLEIDEALSFLKQLNQ